MIDLTAGQLVADKYRVDGVIGAGGMGVVLAATHLDLDQLVAIKVLKDVNSEGIARFQREARLIVRLKSVHVARVFDVGTLDDDTPYFVMERLEGEDLAKVLEKRGPLPVEQAVDYVLEACEAIAEAHTLGMVHRDLKPANLFVARGPGGTGSVKVLDFGVSKAVREGREVGELTNEGVALGSPGYMAPEQIESSRDVDARADIYSLGAILYRLTSGATPHEGDSLMSILASMASKPIRPLGTIAKVPPAFAAVVTRCLAQEPTGRPPSVAVLAQELEPFGSRRGKASVEQILATMGIDHSAASETVPRAHPTPRHREIEEEPPTTAQRRDVDIEPDAETPALDTTIVTPLVAPPMSMSAVAMPVVHAGQAPARSRPRPTSSASILPLGLALLFLAGIVGIVAFSKKTPPPAATSVEAAPSEPEPTVVIAPAPTPSAAVTPTPTTELIELSAPRTATKPWRHAPPRPPAPGPKKTSDAPPSLNDIPGGRH